MFESLIGQQEVKNRLTFYKECHAVNSMCPSLLFVGAAGLGKTAFAREFGHSLKGKGKFIEINCRTIKSMGAFFDQIYMNYIQDKEAVLYFDEAHALPPDLTDCFLTILNPEDNHIITFEAANGMVYEFDFKKIAFIFSTTESQKISAPLRQRLKQIEFDEYSLIDLRNIFANKLKEIKVDNDSLDFLAEVSRDNARLAVLLAKDVKQYCDRKGRQQFTFNDVFHFKSIFGILPHGLNRIEWRLLQILRQKGEATLSNLASCTGLSRGAIQKDHENFLVKKGFINIDGKRKITRFGVQLVDKYQV